MPPNAPQTLSVKRKRHEPPPDALVVERKRLKSDNFSFPLKRKSEQPANEDTKRTKGDSPEGTVVWRRIKSLKIAHGTDPQADASLPPPTPTRRYHVSRASGNVVLFEKTDAKVVENKGGVAEAIQEKIPAAPEPKSSPEQTATPRKRPGAGTALKSVKPDIVEKNRNATNGPSAEVMRQFEQFSNEVESEEVGGTEPTQSSPQKFKPKAPRLRYKDRHPERAASEDPDAMDVDSDEYVYDTYVREIILPDAHGKVPEPEGTIGLIVLTEEDEEWWNGDYESDKEFDTDDEDENAEDYYANDYPEDELSSDDEFDRDPYSYHRDDEEYNLDDDARSDEDDDRPFRQAAPRAIPISSMGYWGGTGEDS